MDLKTGDRIKGWSGGLEFTGTVYETHDQNQGTIKRDDGRTGTGKHIEGYGDGWAFSNLGEYKLELINKTTTMKKISNFFKKLVSPEVAKLSEAGLLDGDLELTEAGKNELLAIVFEDNKERLVKRADEIVMEVEKEESKKK